MDLIASYSSNKVRTFNFFIVSGIMGEKDLAFLFDTGAACSVVGVNNFFSQKDNPNYQKEKEAFEKLLKDGIDAQGITPSPMPLKTANSQFVTTYPCVCHGVSISNTEKRDFYFDISFEEISIPLLGSAFIDDCAYSHAIGGNVVISAMKDNAGADYYTGRKVLDFDKVISGQI